MKTGALGQAQAHLALPIESHLHPKNHIWPGLKLIQPWSDQSFVFAGNGEMLGGDFGNAPQDGSGEVLLEKLVLQNAIKSSGASIFVSLWSKTFDWGSVMVSVAICYHLSMARDNRSARLALKSILLDLGQSRESSSQML